MQILGDAFAFIILQVPEYLVEVAVEISIYTVLDI